MKPFSGFTAALMLATVLAGVAVGLLGTFLWMRVTVVILAIAASAVGSSVLSGRQPRRFVLLAAMALVVMGFFSLHLAQLASPFPLRSLHVAALFAYGAVLLAAVLRLFRVGDEARTLLLSFCIAAPLFAADAWFAPPPGLSRPPQWHGPILMDATLGYRYLPNSTGRTYYPDNARGYFSDDDTSRNNWALESYEGSQGTLEHSESEPGRMRVTVTPAPEAQGWHVKLVQAPFEIRRWNRYSVHFGARADAGRRIGCTVGQNHVPWKLFSPYVEVEVDTDWRSFECPFVAIASESNARIAFDLASDDAPVELRNVVLRDLSSGRDVAPARQFLVDYRFNSLGFRGPDYAIPTPEGTFRILALGDSYTLGAGVYEQDTFAARLEARLNAGAGARGGPLRFEVVNAGVSGYSTRDERVSYERYTSAYEPQLVLIAMVFNDDLSFVEEAKLGYLSVSEPRNLSNLAARILELQQGERTYDYGSTVRELLQLNESCRQRGARLAVVIFRHESWEPWIRLVHDVTEGVRGTGIPVLDLGPILLKDHRPEELTVHPADGHPNEIAHRLAAEEIERFLHAEGMIPSTNELQD
jgi:hypothetical protein